MLTPEKIIPFLTHQDRLVRDLAVNYLSEAHDLSPATAEDIWHCIDSFPSTVFIEAYRALKEMPQTDVSLNRTLSALKSNPDEVVRHHLEQVLMGLKSGLLMRFADLIEQAPGQSDALRAHLKQRMELSSLPAAELWERLMEYGQKFNGGSGDPPFDAAIPERLVDALSHSPEATGWAISTLNDSTIRDWRGVFAVDVLGALRFRPAAEIVLTKFISEEEDDSLMASCISVLVRLGGPKVVDLIQRRFAGMKWGQRLMIADVLRRVKLPQSETAAFALLQSEADLAVRTNLASALCGLATTHTPAIDQLVKMATSHDFDADLAALDEDVPALCTMLGRPTPSFNKKSPPSAQAFLDTRPAAPGFDDEEEIAPPPQMSVAFEQSSPAAQVLKPMRRKGVKVGRNDPCPCGSGKKYKKCCGK